MTVYDNLAFPLGTGARRSRCRPAVTKSRPARTRWRAQAARGGLTADGKQKISLRSRLVRSDVNVIMFDEPLTVIDPHLKGAALQTQSSTTASAHHDLRHPRPDEALTFADQVVVMNDGEVVQIGAPVDLFVTAATHFVGHSSLAGLIFCLRVTAQGVFAR